MPGAEGERVARCGNAAPAPRHRDCSGRGAAMGFAVEGRDTHPAGRAQWCPV